MSGATAADYAWLAEECTGDDGEAGLCLTFVRGLPPDEAFRRIGAVPRRRPADQLIQLVRLLPSPRSRP
ncbi:DUF6461 domain-containing protein [Nonomuraea sp. NPDC003201]